MKELIFPDYVAGSAPALVHLLDKDQGFQDANHQGELVVVKLNETANQIPIFDSRGRPVCTNSQMAFVELVHNLRTQKWKTYVIIEHDRNVLIRLLGKAKAVQVVFVEELGVYGQSKLNYFGEDYSFSTSREPHVYSVSKSCVSVKAYHSGLGFEVDLYIPCDNMDQAKSACKNLDKADLVFVSGMRIPTRFWNLKSRARLAGMTFVASEFWMKEDDYDDVKALIPVIKSYDDVSFFRNIGEDVPLYPDYVNVLLWWNVFYVRVGDPVFNLILSGLPGIAKTHCLGLYAKIFSDLGCVVGEGGTVKGLIPSFSGDEPKLGAFADAKFFVAADEFFKAPGSIAAKAGISKEMNTYNAYLRDLMPIISRIEKIYASAKDNTFSVLMRASFLGSDNIKQETKRSLEALLDEDPAVLRRFIIVFLDMDVWESVKSAQPANDEENLEHLDKFLKKRGISRSSIKRLAMYLRKVSPKIKCDGKRVLELVKALFVAKASEYFRAGTLPDAKFIKSAERLCLQVDFIPHFQAMVKCSCVMRTIFNHNDESFPEYILKDEDYDFASKIFSEVLKSEFFLFDIAISRLLGEGGIIRQ